MGARLGGPWHADTVGEQPILTGPYLAAIHQLQVIGQLTPQTAGEACAWDPRTISAVTYEIERETRLRTVWQGPPGVAAVAALQAAFQLASQPPAPA